MQRGSDISVSFSNGDRFGAVATSSGQVKMYKNTTLLATVDVSAWPYYASGGYIGIWTIGASGNVLDDFGGGNVPQSYTPLQSLAAFWASIRGWFGGAKEADLVPLAVSLREAEVKLNQVSTKPAGVEPPTGVIWRCYYYAGSQRVAMRIHTSVETHVYYLHTDHLGSTSLTTNESGMVMSEIRYKAWGEVRYASGATPTDYKYTGQLETDIGIYFFVSRFFDLSIGRFLSPDSIIPAPGNPITFDRYAYVFNSPLVYVDPSGHTPVCGFSYSDPECYSDYVDPYVPPAIVVFSVDPIHPQDWTGAEVQAIRDEALKVAEAYANAINIRRKNNKNNQLGLIAAREAFLMIHEGPIFFIRTSATMGGWAGQSLSKNEVIIYNLQLRDGSIQYNYLENHPRVIVHEIGHCFDWANDEWGADVKDGLASAGLLFRNNATGFSIGFTGGINDWTFSDSLSSGEIFADMFVGWVYGAWGANKDRREFMTRMAPFIVNYLDP